MSGQIINEAKKSKLSIMWQKYIVVMNNGSVYNTELYDFENNWSDSHTCVIDVVNGLVTQDGETWTEIVQDRL